MEYIEKAHELQMTDLEIKWSDCWNSNNRGHMTIHLGVFMDEMKVSDLKKLLKIIRSSDTPDEEQKIKEYCLFFTENRDEGVQEIQKRIMGYEQKVHFCEQQVKELVEYRDKFKKRSAEYKAASDKVKSAKNDLSLMKMHLSNAKANLNKYNRETVFLNKCLELLNQ